MEGVYRQKGRETRKKCRGLATVTLRTVKKKVSVEDLDGRRGRVSM